MVQFCGLFYKLRKISNRSQLIKIFNTYVKTVVQYGILVYGTASRATMQKNDAKINRILRVIFFVQKFDSVSLIREKYKVFSAQELHLYEVFKLMTKCIRRESCIMDINHFITQNELSKLCSCEKRVKALPLNSSFSENSLSNKIRKLLNVFLKLDSNFVTKVENLSGARLNNFAHEKLENYFLLNEQLTRLIYGLN